MPNCGDAPSPKWKSQKLVASGKSAPHPSMYMLRLPVLALSMNAPDSCSSRVTVMPTWASWSRMSLATWGGWGR